MALLYSMVFSIHRCGKYKCLSSTLINYVFFKKNRMENILYYKNIKNEKGMKESSEKIKMY
jgi:hypothetical protein